MSSKAEDIDQSDIILNRINLQLARNRSILSSWGIQPSDQTDKNGDEADDNDFDFAPVNERAGVDAKVPKDDDDILGGLRQGRTTLSQDKLLELLIGKKAATAKRKADAEQKKDVRVMGSSHVGSMPVGKVRVKDKEVREECGSESESEVEGRAAAFGRKKGAPSKWQLEVGGEPPIAAVEKADVEVKGEPKLDSDAQEGIAKNSPVVTRANPDEAPKKRQAGSYLDEMLSQKASKKKKHRKKP